MGMMDFVTIMCPKCKVLVEGQSKTSCNPDLRRIAVNEEMPVKDAVIAVGADYLDCTSCKTSYTVEMDDTSTVRVRVVEIDLNTSDWRFWP